MAKYQELFDTIQAVMTATNDATRVNLDVQSLLTPLLAEEIRTSGSESDLYFEVPDNLEVEVLASIIALHDQLGKIMVAANPSTLKAAQRQVNAQGG